jgi:outer membrane receptor for Fe3+-dicitrate
VLIDGRSVYTPLFSGVYWNVQDVFLEDVDRIEVIRGPGATLWGANAVNGVINIITKDAQATQNGLFTAKAETKCRASPAFGMAAKRVARLITVRTQNISNSIPLQTSPDAMHSTNGTPREPVSASIVIQTLMTPSQFKGTFTTETTAKP